MNRQLLVAVSSDYLIWALPCTAAVVLLACSLALLSGIFEYRTKQVLGIISVAALALVASQVNLNWSSLLDASNSSWANTVSATLLIFAAYGGLWVTASADFAKSIAPTSSGFKVYGWAKLALVVAPILSGAVGILLAQDSSATDLFVTLSSTSWMPSVVTGFICVSLIVWISYSIKSAALSLRALGIKISNTVQVIVISALVVAATLVAYTNKVDAWNLLAQYLPIGGVVLLAWAGLFISEVLIRRIAYHEVSLQRGYGIYKAINWVSVFGFLISVTLGFGAITVKDQAWVGYLIQLLPAGSFWQQAQLGLAISFFVSALFPVAFGIRRIKRQEAEVLAIENRKNDLLNVPF